MPPTSHCNPQSSIRALMYNPPSTWRTSFAWERQHSKDGNDMKPCFATLWETPKVPSIQYPSSLIKSDLLISCDLCVDTCNASRSCRFSSNCCSIAWSCSANLHRNIAVPVTDPPTVLVISIVQGVKNINGPNCAPLHSTYKVTASQLGPRHECQVWRQFQGLYLYTCKWPQEGRSSQRYGSYGSNATAVLIRAALHLGTALELKLFQLLRRRLQKLMMNRFTCWREIEREKKKEKREKPFLQCHSIL